MNITKIELNNAQISGNEDGTGIAIGIAPGYEYVDGQRTDNITYMKLEVVFPDNGYEKINVKIKDLKLLLTAEQLEKQGGKKKVKLKNLTGRFYRTGSGDYALSATADAMEVIQ